MRPLEASFMNPDLTANFGTVSSGFIGFEENKQMINVMTGGKRVNHNALVFVT